MKNKVEFSATGIQDSSHLHNFLRWLLIIVQHQVRIEIWSLCSVQFSAASSVDAERAFSLGRLEVNHLQHNMSPQTFKAQVAVGSWAKSPFWPGPSEITKIIEREMRVSGEIPETNKSVVAEEELGSSDTEF